MRKSAEVARKLDGDLAAFHSRTGSPFLFFPYLTCLSNSLLLTKHKGKAIIKHIKHIGFIWIEMHNTKIG